MKLPHRRRFLHLVAAGAAAPSALPRREIATYPAGRCTSWSVLLPAAPPTSARDSWANGCPNGWPAIHHREPDGRRNQYRLPRPSCARPQTATLLVVTASNAINATLYDKLNFNFLRDIAPVAGVMLYPLVMQVNPSFPAKTVPEFISYAKANPGKISYGSGGNGTSIQVATELFKMMTGIEMTHVPYRGGAPAMTDLMGGQVQVVFNPVPESMQFIRAGKLAPAGGDDRDSFGGVARCPDLGRLRAGLRGKRAGHRRAQGYAGGDHIDKLNKEINLASPIPN
jgi:hypothetical protein